MKTLGTFVLALLSLLAVQLGAAQPIAWEQRQDLTSQSMAATDGAGNYYWVTREGGYVGSTLTLWKVRATGAVIFKKIFKDTSHSGSQYLKCQAITTDGTTVYVAMESYEDFYGFDPFDETVFALNAADGSEKWHHYLEPSGSYYIPEAMALVGDKLALGGYSHTNGSPNTDHPAAVWLNLSDGSEAYNYVFSIFNGQFRSMCADSAGSVYLAGVSSDSGGNRLLVKMQAITGIIWFKALDLIDYQSEQTIEMAISPDGTALALGSEGASVSNGRDLLLSTHSTTTGNYIGSKIVSTPSDDALAHIAFDGTSVFISAYLNSFGPRLTVKRFDRQLLSEQWSVDVAGSFSGGSLSVDPMTGLIVGSTRSVPVQTYDSQFDRFNIADGALIWHMQGDADGIDGPRAMFVDSASNVFATGYRNNQAGEYFARFQFVTVAFPGPTAYGGGPVAGSVSLASPAPAAGITLQMSTSLAGGSISPTLFIAGGATSAPFNLITPAVSANLTGTVTARWNGIVEAASIVIVPPVLQSLAIAPATVFGGTNTIGTLTLTGKAPAGGQSVGLASNLASAATVPVSVTVPAGGTTIGFTVTTLPQLVSHMVGITATTGSVAKTAYVTVNAPTLTGISLAPDTVKGGTSSVLIISLDAKAPANDVVYLVSGAPALVVLPANVTMTPDLTAKSLGVPTTAVAVPISVTIFAYQPGTVKTATLTLTP